MKKFIKIILKFNKQEKAFLKTILGALLITVLFAGQVRAQEVDFSPTIALTKEANILVLNDKKVEIQPGLSKEDYKQLNTNPNPEIIQRFMQGIAPEYGIDWKLVYAIGYHESAVYKSSLARNNNNYFGRKAVGGGYAKWATPEEGIRDQFRYLKERYFDRGLDTPEKINRVYAEDMGWHYKVESVMAKL